MSFIGNLSKGFIRSAVNQVGRDGGKVISNQVYGNSHSTPLNITHNSSDIQDSTSLFEEKEYIYVKFFWAILISSIPFIGGLFIFARGIINFNKKNKLMYRVEKQSTYKSDKRFKSGAKFTGYIDVKIPVKILIDQDQKNKNIFKAITYCLIGIASITIYIIHFRK